MGKRYTLNLIKETHSILMESVRGRDKGRGQFRMVQNWIGKRKNAPIEDATFIPPEPWRLKDSLSNLEKYIHYSEKDPLVQLAIVHAQFELIHPFVDGNGRVGRILIPLFLYEKGLLPSPMFYLSEYLEAHRDIYYEQLQTISVTGDWGEWITFFLTAITEQAKANSKKATDIQKLYERMKTEIAELTHSQFAIRTLDAIFERPVFLTVEFAKRTGIHRQSAMRILRALQKAKILIVLRARRGSRPALLMFRALLMLAEGLSIEQHT